MTFEELLLLFEGAGNRRVNLHGPVRVGIDGEQAAQIARIVRAADEMAEAVANLSYPKEYIDLSVTYSRLKDRLNNYRKAKDGDE